MSVKIVISEILQSAIYTQSSKKDWGYFFMEHEMKSFEECSHCSLTWNEIGPSVGILMFLEGLSKMDKCTVFYVFWSHTTKALRERNQTILYIRRKS